MDDTQIKQLKDLIDSLEGRSRAESWELEILFNLYNVNFPQQKEYAKYCTSCVERVYKRMKKIRQEL